MTKINPDSVVLQQLDGQWQKIAALLLWKLSPKAVVRIMGADIEAFNAAYAPGGPVVFTHGMIDRFEFSLVTEEAAKRLAEHDATMRGNA